MDDTARPIGLRAFRPMDAEVVVGWFHEHADALAVAGTGAPWPYTAEDLVRASAGADRRPLTATPVGDPDLVVGHVAIVRVSETSGRLARIVLAPHLRGQGHSGTLVALTVQQARALGLTELALFVVPGNVRALGAWTAAGFVHADADPEHPAYVRLVQTWPAMPGAGSWVTPA